MNQLKLNRIGGFAGLAALLLSTLFFAAGAGAALEDDIRERLEPIGELCQVGEDCAAGLAVAGGGEGAGMGPEMVYQTYCQACHETGANDSPVRGDADAWAPRLEKGMETLYQHAIEGFNNNAMPPKGLCMSCTDEEVMATVDYLLEPVLQE